MQSKPLPKWLDRLGDWNPQLLRELKGRMNDRSFLVTIGLSLIGQLIFLMFWFNQISNYPMPCSATNCPTNWESWFRAVFQNLNWLMPYIIYLPGIYYLTTDLMGEERRGTLNFLRLSPRSSQNILLGKLLGVPVALYFAVLLLLPLHVIVGIKAQAPIVFFLSYYAILIGSTIFLFTLSLLIGLSGRSSQDNKNTGGVIYILGLLFAVAMGFIPLVQNLGVYTFWNFAPQFIIDNRYGNGFQNSMTWFWMILSQHPILSHSLFLGNLAIMTTLFWQMTQRAFQNPNANFLVKRQSYFLIPYFTILMIGFVCRVPFNDESIQELSGEILVIGGLFSLSVMTPIIMALSTSRQTTLDWINSRSDHAWNDRIWGDRSPGTTAIAINILMMIGILTVPVLFNTKPNLITPQNFALVLLIQGSLCMIYSLLFQGMLLVKSPKRKTWANLLLFGAIGLPLLLSIIFGFGTSKPTFLLKAILLMSPLTAPFTLGSWDGLPPPILLMDACIVLGFQAAIIGFLYLRLRSQLRKLERS